MASTTYTPAHGSKPAVHLTPHMFGDLMTWADSFAELTVKSVDQAVQVVTRRMQEDARRDEAWAPFSDLLYFSFEEGELLLMMSGSSEEQRMMETLEYGTAMQPPRPFIRTQMNKQSAEFAQILGKLIEKDIPLV